MTDADKAQAVEALSPRARDLYRRLCDGGFYRSHAHRTPRAMEELSDAGLIKKMTRPVGWTVCFVPVGSIPWVGETIQP